MIVTLHHYGMSWWFHQHCCAIRCSDGRKLDYDQDPVVTKYGGTWEVHEVPDGIEVRYFYVSSGQGKTFSHKRLVLPRNEYTEVRHTGNEPSAPSAETLELVRKANEPFEPHYPETEQ